jgi:hypothetical protein
MLWISPGISNLMTAFSWVISARWASLCAAILHPRFACWNLHCGSKQLAPLISWITPSHLDLDSVLLRALIKVRQSNLMAVACCCRSKPTGEQCLNNTRSREAHVAADGAPWPLNYGPRDWHTPSAMDRGRATWSLPSQEGDDVSQLFSCAQRHGKH